MDKFDFLVMGGGVAGLRAAIEASLAGSVLLLNKGGIHESASQKAQGGIAAVLNAEEEELESHYQDTLDAGRGMCHSDAVRILVQEGPERVDELIQWGAQFDKIGAMFAQVLEGVHKKPRILRANGDATGLEIVRTLAGQAKKCKNLTFLPDCFVMDLIVEAGACKGVWVVDEGRMYPITAQGLILATGGAGHIFERTTNPPLATGDGIAMALRAGAFVEDMEFVQFHPTALELPEAPPFLLSEAMRGEGARLVNSHGKPFMTAYHPDGDLAPRDIVTRGIFREMSEGQKVFLDLTHLASDFVRQRFPTIDATCRAWGIDMTCSPLPVAPAAHYMMGGVKTDLTGKTSVGQLWAAGEVASTGVHGANRLASNALLEGLVFGARAGRAAAEATHAFPPLYVKRKPDEWGYKGSSFSNSPTDDPALKKRLQAMMWRDVGIIRSHASLERAQNQLRAMQFVLSAPLGDVPPAALRKILELRNEMMVAASIVAAAFARKESIGAHFREDAPLTAETQRVSLPHKEPLLQNPPDHFSFQWRDIWELLF